MNDKPLISIVIPCLNEEAYLPNVLTSILRQQGAPSFEIIVADCGSTDKTVEIAQRFANKVASNCQKSAAHARQAGAKLAEGDLIAFIDADVILPPKFLSNIPKNFKDSNIVLAYGPIAPLESNDLERFFIKGFFTTYLGVMDKLKKPMGIGTNLIVRKNAFEKINGFNTSMKTGEDLDLQKRMLIIGKLKYNKDLWVYASMRRVHKWGFKKFVTFHVKNTVNFLQGKETAQEYESTTTSEENAKNN